MGEHNNAMCGFFAHEENYADFWNGVLFRGRREIKPEELQQMNREYYTRRKRNEKNKRKTKELRRDIIMKRCKQGNAEILLGMELMDTMDYTMPVRKMLYDAEEYQRQVATVIRQNRERAKRLEEETKAEEPPKGKKYWRNSGEFLYGLRKEDRLIPLITVALYCGAEQYDGCNNLSDMLKSEQIETEFRKWIAGYPLHLIVLRDLREEYFHTGLRELIGVIKRSGDREALLQYYQEHKERFAKLDEVTVETIGIMIGNHKLLQYPQEQGGLDMCKAFEDAKEEGIREGIKEGIKEGIVEGEERYARLTRELYIRERMADIMEAAINMEYRNRLFQEFHL